LSAAPDEVRRRRVTTALTTAGRRPRRPAPGRVARGTGRHPVAVAAR